MKLTKLDIRMCKELAATEGIPVGEVKKAVVSYFDSLVSSARQLPFDNAKRIYSLDAFKQYPLCINIPYLGRLGPVYSLYIKWRAKEAKSTEKVLRSLARKDHTKPLVEQAAKLALAGHKVDGHMLKGRLPAGKYSTVWVIDKEGKKKAARQMIVNTKQE